MRWKYPLFCLLLAATLCGISSKSYAASNWSSACKYPTAVQMKLLPWEYPRFYKALRKYFKGQWRNAAITAWAEGGWNARAANGQYLGTFQMGAWARLNYGHSHTLEGQVYHAYRNWRVNGWGQWECSVPWV